MCIRDSLKARQAYLHYERELVEGLTEKLTLNYRTFFSVADGINFKQVQTDGTVSDVDQFHSMEVDLETHYGPGQKWFESYFGRAPLTYFKPVTTFNYTLGFINGLNNKNYNYHKFELLVKHHWANRLGTTKYEAKAGKVFGTAPYPLLTMHQGNQSFVYNRFAFNVMSEFEFISDQYASLSVAHHFGGLIMNRIPLIKKLKLRSLITGKILYGNISNKNRDLVLLPAGASSLDDRYIYDYTVDDDTFELTPSYKASEKYYLELGFGIENIFKVIRVEAIWRITQRDKIDRFEPTYDATTGALNGYNPIGVTKWGIKIALAPSL